MGIILARLFPPNFEPPRDIPDLSGKKYSYPQVMIMTGGNTGIDYETVKQLVLRNTKLPALKKSYEETNIPTRVINTSSGVHWPALNDGIESVSLKGGPERDARVKKKGNLRVRDRVEMQSYVIWHIV
ncbi:hypothetical protein B0H14DRAFT_2648728 [Mycena olivaceomarginata]|nr:hypothetical protein B0H14DRAFT_2648728 [Mycena olivaceomarginata]